MYAKNQRNPRAGSGIASNRLEPLLPRPLLSLRSGCGDGPDGWAQTAAKIWPTPETSAESQRGKGVRGWRPDWRKLSSPATSDAFPLEPRRGCRHAIGGRWRRGACVAHAGSVSLRFGRASWAGPDELAHRIPPRCAVSNAGFSHVGDARAGKMFKCCLIINIVIRPFYRQLMFRFPAAKSPPMYFDIPFLVLRSACLFPTACKVAFM